MPAPLTKTARQARIAELIESSCIPSQSEFVMLLAKEGITVTQGTLSKDLVDLGAVRVRNVAGELCYSLDAHSTAASAPEKLAKLTGELLVSAEGSVNIAVLHTLPGAAQFFASAVDKVGWSEVLGTIAGDDTVLIITRDATGGEKMATTLLNLFQTTSN